MMGKLHISLILIVKEKREFLRIACGSSERYDRLKNRDINIDFKQSMYTLSKHGYFVYNITTETSSF